jgi:hypothetical protein
MAPNHRFKAPDAGSAAQLRTRWPYTGRFVSYWSLFAKGVHGFEARGAGRGTVTGGERD